MVVMNSYGIVNSIHYNYHYNHSSILRQWYSCLILHCINTILYLFSNTLHKFTMVDLLINQLYQISNGMIMNTSVINNYILSSNSVLFLLFRMLSIIFVFIFSCCNDNMKSISIRLIFCLISIFGDAVDIKLYLSKEYDNVNGCLVCLIDDSCLEWDCIILRIIIYLLIMIILILVYSMHLVYMIQFKDMVTTEKNQVYYVIIKQKYTIGINTNSSWELIQLRFSIKWPWL